MKLYGLALRGIWHFRLLRSSQIAETLDDWDQSVHDWMEVLIMAEAQICRLHVEGEDLAVGRLAHDWDQSVHDWMEALITVEAQICRLRVEGEDLAVEGLAQMCANPQKNRRMMLAMLVWWKYLACRKKGEQAAWKCRMTFPS